MEVNENQTPENPEVEIQQNTACRPEVDIPEDNSLEAEVKSLQSLCNGLQSQLVLKEKEVEAERALKWIHFENAAKFDEEIRELKKLLKDIASQRLTSEIEKVDGEVSGDFEYAYDKMIETARQVFPTPASSPESNSEL